MNKILIVGGEITESCLDGTVKVKSSKKKENSSDWTHTS